MKRRKFIQNTVIGSAAAFSIPYILPTGRLFAQTGTKLADHVVFVAFAGGVRQQESVLQRYWMIVKSTQVQVILCIICLMALLLLTRLCMEQHK